MLHEVVSLFRLILKIKVDLKSLISFLEGNNSNYNLLKLKIDIENNILPEEWRKLGFKIQGRNLCDYLNSLFQKISYIQAITS